MRVATSTDYVCDTQSMYANRWRFSPLLSLEEKARLQSITFPSKLITLCWLLLCNSTHPDPSLSIVWPRSVDHKYRSTWFKWYKYYNIVSNIRIIILHKRNWVRNWKHFFAEEPIVRNHYHELHGNETDWRRINVNGKFILIKVSTLAAWHDFAYNILQNSLARWWFCIWRRNFGSVKRK